MNAEASLAVADDTRPLRMNDVGPYAEITHRPNPRGLVIVFMPTLVATLWRAEMHKGGELTPEEVLRIRDRCNVFVTVPDAARAAEDRRGYPDLDPTNPYASWQHRKCRGV